MPLVAASELVAAVRAQDRDGVFVQGHGTAAGGGLGLAFDNGVAGRGALAFDEQQSAVRVDGRPPQPAQFTAAQASEGAEPPEREQRVIADAVQEGGELCAAVQTWACGRR